MHVLSNDDVNSIEDEQLPMLSEAEDKNQVGKNIILHLESIDWWMHIGE
jgi:hypothetical protein